jgi:hypothetical protein
MKPCLSFTHCDGGGGAGVDVDGAEGGVVVVEGTTVVAGAGAGVGVVAGAAVVEGAAVVVVGAAVVALGVGFGLGANVGVGGVVGQMSRCIPIARYPGHAAPTAVSK